jgi:glycine oxidase
VSHEDVVIVGAGVMGCSIARRLAQRGHRVRVLERSIPGAEASSVAAGILAPLVEHEESGPMRSFGVASRELHASMAEALREETGLDVGFVRSGVLQIALDEASASALDRTTAALVGARFEKLDPRLAREREPAVSEAVRLAIDLPDEAQVEPKILLRALALSAERAGARFSSGVAVRGLKLQGERVVGIETDDGLVPCAHAIIAAGSWTSLVPGLSTAHARAIRPVRGQLVHVELRAPIFRRIVFGEGAYVVPRRDGRVVCGATSEEAGFSKEVTLGGVLDVGARAVRLVPGLASARFVAPDVSFRPASSDGLPLIGPAGPDGLWLATGHFRNGILLAPATAELVSAMVSGETTALPIDPSAFDPRRMERA